MLDRDLALLYGVETKTLNRAVKRNITRFPEDFMFQLIIEEEKYVSSRYQFGTLNNELGLDKANLRYQIGTSSSGYGGRRYKTYAFTEQGVAMLSSVLRSERAIQVNIQIMRTFTKIREMLGTNKELREKIEKLESKYDSQFEVVFKAIKQLLTEPENDNKSPIGFSTE
jgi:phage regulator Rha-like protein